MTVCGCLSGCYCAIAKHIFQHVPMLELVAKVLLGGFYMVNCCLIVSRHTIWTTVLGCPLKTNMHAIPYNCIKNFVSIFVETDLEGSFCTSVFKSLMGLGGECLTRVQLSVKFFHFTLNYPFGVKKESCPNCNNHTIL